jgi:hypothetical protein
MKSFYCDSCGWLVHFENTKCLKCGSALAYLPDTGRMGSAQGIEAGNWQSSTGEHYRLCRNYIDYNVCNWAVSADNSNDYCVSCRLNQMIPNLSLPGSQAAWAKFESAKRRLDYTLLNLGLAVTSKAENRTRHRLLFCKAYRHRHPQRGGRRHFRSDCHSRRPPLRRRTRLGRYRLPARGWNKTAIHRPPRRTRHAWVRLQ